MQVEGAPASPEVTVVVTTRDRGELALRAVQSALSQRAVQVEVVVVDDGSRTPFRYPPASGVRVIRHDRPRGVCAARNTGWRAAAGGWVMFLDDDDELLPEMAAASLSAVRSSSLPRPVSTLSGMRVVDGAGRVVESRMPVTLTRGSHYFLEDSNGGSFWTHNTLLAERSLLEKIGGWDEDLRSSEHDDFFLRLNRVSSIEGVPRVLYVHRSDASTRLSKDLLARAEAMNRTVARHREVFRQHRRRYARYLSAMGITFLRGGRWFPAVVGTTRSLVVHPGSAEGWKRWLVALLGPSGLRFYRSVVKRHLEPRS